MSFSLREIDRYARQILLPEWGAAGQERLKAAQVAVSGRSAAAAMLVRYLAAAGVGRLRVATRPLAALATQLNPHIQVELDGAEVAAHAPEATLVKLPHTELRCDDPRHSTGAALAVETLKALLGLPYHAVVTLPLPAAGDAEAAR